MNQPLRYAVIEITNRCNLRCRHCASTSGAARQDELSLSEIAVLLQDIRSLGGKEITIIGGEVMMRDDWRDICRAVTAQGMRLMLISNGTRMSIDDTLPELKALQPYLIGISLDGADPDSYRRLRGVDRFDHVMALLHGLKADGHPHVNAITTFTRENIRDFDAFADLLKNTGITWQVQLANKGGQRFDEEQFITRDDFHYWVEKMKSAYLNRPGLRLRHMDDFGYCPIDPKLRFLHQTWKGCIAGRQLIGVRSNGDILGCLSLGDGFEEANIREVPLETIWRSDRYFRRCRDKTAHLTGTCARCPHGQECQAGCTAIAVSATGHIGENPYCIRLLETESILQSLVG